MNEEDDNMSNYLGLQKDGILFTAPSEEQFIKEYKKAWETVMSKMYFQSETIDMGHKLRPRLVFWGYLSGLEKTDLKENELKDVAQIAVCMELIHKSSLIIDDFIDKDTTRHSKPAFYVNYGVERTIIYSLNILSHALEIVNEIFSKHDGNKNFYYKGMREIVNTLKEMSWGVLEELDLDQLSMVNVKKIQEIMHYETSSLITNSLLMGYYLTCNDNPTIESVLKNIGKNLGYIFQILNDMESFYSTKINEHKGSQNTDINRLRKNICIPVLYATMSIYEKRKYRLDDITDEVIMDLLNKHKIKNIMLKEISDVVNKINRELSDNRNVFSAEWLNLFTCFIDSVLSVFKGRID